MIHKPIFLLAHHVYEPKFYWIYKNLTQNQWKNYEELKTEQEIQLRNMINFAYNNVPFYHKMFIELKLNPNQIRNLEDLEKLPVLTKDIIKRNWDDLKPINLHKIKYYDRSTGGSTGTPLKYRLSKFDRFLGGAIWYRGWGYAGYDLGDKVVFLGGASLDIDKKQSLAKKFNEQVRNIKLLSSFDLSEADISRYITIINSFKPKLIYGYASSLYFFAKWVEGNDINIHFPSAIIPTSEKLYPNMKEKIQQAFCCDVYDSYGLNDGGISCYTCPENHGLHIDTERSIMEIVDKNGIQLIKGEGKIIATSLYNYAMPFIRYDTGDLGDLTDEVCSCGRGYKLLKEIVGRSVDILVTPEGKNVHGWFFLYIFWRYCTGIKEYQVVQKNINTIIIKIIPEPDFDENQLDQIRRLVDQKSEGWEIKFKFVEKIERTRSGKYKFVINEMDSIS